MEAHSHDDPHAPIEQAPGDPDYFDVLQMAIREILVEKGLIGADEVRAMIETLDAAEPAHGSALVARAWSDPAFKERLLADGTAAIKEFGIDNYDGTQLIVLEQTPDTHNLVVCTLCSCYPRPVLGLPPTGTKAARTGPERSVSRGRCWPNSARKYPTT
jgi:hypothetical protein